MVGAPTLKRGVLLRKWIATMVLTHLGDLFVHGKWVITIVTIHLPSTRPV